MRLFSWNSHIHLPRARLRRNASARSRTAMSSCCCSAPRYGTPEKSGKSPTHEEFDHARSVGKTDSRVRWEDVDDRDVAQSDFLVEISGWEDGYFRTKYSKPITLVTAIVKALTALATRAEAPAAAGPTDRLPPVCLNHIESLRESSPDDADRLVELLTDSASRQPGVLSHLAGNPQSWLAEAGYAVWETISDFIDAHDLGDSESTRRLAIEAASPRSSLYCIRHAVSCAEEGDQERAEDLLAQVPSRSSADARGTGGHRRRSDCCRGSDSALLSYTRRKIRTWRVTA